VDDLTMFGYEAKDFLTWLGTGLILIILFIAKQWQAKAKDHDDHLKKIDEALHQMQLQMVEQRMAAADIKEFQNELEKLDNRLDRVEHVLTRIDERLGGKRRATDPNPDDL
jgi:DNA-binding transcriptional regulator GbsR (MarR family)